MENFTFIIFLLLCLALPLSLIRKGSFAVSARIARMLIVLSAAAYFTVWFVKRSKYPFVMDAMAVQIINKLPQALDFYVVRVNDAESPGEPYDLKHAGRVRPEHYQVEYLKMDHSGEFWIAGYLGKKNMVYFSQHAVSNRSSDQVVEIHNYINQSQKLSKTAGLLIDAQKMRNHRSSIYVTLSFLLIFLNGVLLFRRH
ncbi:hypothetical protein [Chryseobacterium sp.]|uniref:hypothetical protein n=1 Tax=Chryseobacterium sp. TaxID=1871047 RepID=UPI0012A9E346|nr:hypothetical protein [Chryseobacterium sp.]QFG53770.1 hypothetical protein F7R58_09480 [Chryseobacterium sp.]